MPPPKEVAEFWVYWLSEATAAVSWYRKRPPPAPDASVACQPHDTLVSLSGWDCFKVHWQLHRQPSENPVLKADRHLDVKPAGSTRDSRQHQAQYVFGTHVHVPFFPGPNPVHLVPEEHIAGHAGIVAAGLAGANDRRAAARVAGAVAFEVVPLHQQVVGRLRAQY